MTRLVGEHLTKLKYTYEVKISKELVHVCEKAYKSESIKQVKLKLLHVSMIKNILRIKILTKSSSHMEAK